MSFGPSFFLKTEDKPIGTADPDAYFSYVSATAAQGTIPLTPGRWYYYAIVNSENSVDVWINGIKDSNAPTKPRPTSTAHSEPVGLQKIWMGGRDRRSTPGYGPDPVPERIHQFAHVTYHAWDSIKDSFDAATGEFSISQPPLKKYVKQQEAGFCNYPREALSVDLSGTRGTCLISKGTPEPVCMDSDDRTVCTRYNAFPVDGGARKLRAGEIPFPAPAQSKFLVVIAITKMVDCVKSTSSDASSNCTVRKSSKCFVCLKANYNQAPSMNEYNSPIWKTNDVANTQKREYDYPACLSGAEGTVRTSCANMHAVEYDGMFHSHVNRTEQVDRWIDIWKRTTMTA
jgi:hypothetical protein